MPAEEDVIRRRVRVTGGVQGVYFRHETRERARALGVAGWVRNAPDGSVEAVFEGPRDRVDSIVGWCRRGPAAARVAAVETEDESPQGRPGFSIR